MINYKVFLISLLLCLMKNWWHLAVYLWLSVSPFHRKKLKSYLQKITHMPKVMTWSENNICANLKLQTYWKQWLKLWNMIKKQIPRIGNVKKLYICWFFFLIILCVYIYKFEIDYFLALHLRNNPFHKYHLWLHR